MIYHLKRRGLAIALVGVLLLISGGMIYGSMHLHPLGQQGPAVFTPTVDSSPTGSAGHAPRPLHYRARLIIPAIHLNAPIEAVGTQPDGSMDVPTKNQWKGVGWYQEGPFPGERGSAVLDGHLNRPGNLPAVFWNLNKLQVGDRITISREKKMLHFVVKRVAYYDTESAPLDKIFGDDSGHYLNLITCAGQWIPRLRQTTERLVIYSKLISK